MSNQNPEAGKTNNWRPAQAYGMAVVCLLIGIPVGYFLHAPVTTPPASQPPVTQSVAMPGAASPAQPAGEQKMPTLDDMKRMADKQAQPLLAKLKSDPKNPEVLHQLGLIYRATHQFKEAAGYYAKALQYDPKNVTMRADYATCLYYQGDVDGALAQLNKSLTYEPNHPGTLMNIGIIKLKGKHDPQGAIAAWEKLLKENPNFEQRQVIEHLIEQAKKQSTVETAQTKG